MLWQYKDSDGKFYNYSDLACILINIQYQKFIKEESDEDKEQYKFVEFDNGKYIDFEHLAEFSIHNPEHNLPIKKLSSHLRHHDQLS